MNLKVTPAPFILNPEQIASWSQPSLKPESQAPIIASVPTLQRGLVWNPSQIELLWDSLLRGFPIGSLVVCPRIPGQDDGEDTSVSHHLLDGQQRSNAISLGFHDPFSTLEPKATALTILWIDLLPKIPAQSTREFLVRLTTAAHPWGYSHNDTCSPLRAWQIREILGRFGLETSSPDYVRPHPMELFPAEAAVPVPMAWLVRQDGDEAEKFWIGILRRCEAVDTPWSHRVRNFIEDSSEESMRARETAFDAIRRFRDSQIVALPAPDLLIHATRAESAVSGTHGENSAIEQLFQRLNRQGTRLDGEELAYSMIKAYWPQVAKPIQRIGNRRMPASRMVMMAARAALTLPGSTHLRSPLSVSDIRSLASKRDEDAVKVLSFIEDRLKPCCAWIEDALLFNPQTHPTGLLPVHLAHIARSQPDIYLLLLCLADRHLRSGAESETMESLRLPLLALVCRMAWFAVDSAKAANLVLVACGENVTGDAIRQSLSRAEQQGWLVELPDPDEVSVILDFDNEAIDSWNWYSPIKGDGVEIGVQERQRRWGAFFQCLGNRDLLLYAQREFIARRFFNFDPSRRDLWEGHNRPWDFDHIHAKALVYNLKSGNRFQNFLKQWLDTPGNLRAWPFEDNRSDSAEPADAKILTPEQLSDSFMLSQEIAAFSMGRDPLNDESAARSFAKTCRDRLLRIYGECWKQMR